MSESQEHFNQNIPLIELGLWLKMNGTDENEARHFDAIEHTAKLAAAFTDIVAALGTASLVLSILHELGFYFSLDLSLMTLVGASDYLKQAIRWLPFYSGLLIIVFVDETVSANKLKKVQSLAAAIGQPKIAKDFERKHRRRNLPFDLLWWTVALPLALPLPWPNLLLIAIFLYVVRSRRVLALWDRAPQNLALVGLPTVLFVCAALSFGLAEGGYARSSVRLFTPTDVSVKIRGSDATRRMPLLRYLERGILCLDGDKVILIPWSSIDESLEIVPKVGSLGDLIRYVIPARNK